MNFTRGDGDGEETGDSPRIINILKGINNHLRYKVILILIFLINIITEAQNSRITFEVTTYKLDDTVSVYVTGNNEKLGNWDPSFIKLNKERNNWKIELSFPKGTKLEYKFILGGWEREALTEKGETPNNSILNVEKDTLVSVKINRWASGAPRKISFQGQITGDVRYHRNFKGKGLLQRDIIVWLPPSYEKATLKRYPVLYAHDGQNLFDPATSSFQVDWQLDETADSLIKQGKIREIIIVGIYNTPDRMREYYTGDTG
jgi:hypothetical protein